MRKLREASIEVDIDSVLGIAHNKIIIIDQQKVITGSFNFTTSADIRNTENVIIVNNSEIAKKYIQNWFSRKEHSEINKLKKQTNAQ
jgi:phospholipase D